MGDVVVLAFLVPESVNGLSSGTPTPKRQLVGTARVAKSATGSAKLLLELDHEAMKLTDLDGSRALRAGTYRVVFSSGVSGGEVGVALTLTQRAPGVVAC